MVKKMKAISLMYHDVCDDPITSGFVGDGPALYKITPAEFLSQLDAISKKITEPPVRVSDIDDNKTLIFITFDDGGKSALKAAELLEKKNWRGHFFVTTGKIGTENFVGKNEIVELHRRGHIVGSHSDSHPLRMASLSREKIFNEWRNSTEKLAEILGERIKAASVPGGLYSPQVSECAEENGIEFLFNSEPTTKIHKVGRCLVLGRYAVQNWMKVDEIAAIAGGDLVPRLKQSLIWNAKKPLKKLGGENFLKLRNFLVQKRRKGL